MIERLRRATFCLNIGPGLRNGDTTAARRAQRGDPDLVRKSMSDIRATRLSRLVDELTEAAKRLGLEVRRERILREVGYRARGGACRLREKRLIIIDRDQPPSEQIEVLVEALRDCDLEQLYLSPEARRILQSGPEQT